MNSNRAVTRDDIVLDFEIQSDLSNNISHYISTHNYSFIRQFDINIRFWEQTHVYTRILRLVSIWIPLQ